MIFPNLNWYNEFQITKPKYLKEILPLRAEFTEGITSSGSDCKPNGTFSFHKQFFQTVPRNIMKSLVNFN